MSTLEIQRCIHARPRHPAPQTRGVLLAMRVAPDAAPTGVLVSGGFIWDEAGPEAVT